MNFFERYGKFNASITELDCGLKCAPYNERGVPFCCDTNHTIPTAYQSEWEYLSANTNLWHLYQPVSDKHDAELRRQLPDGQVMIECLGHQLCQRNFRSFVCRSFPFFPYISRNSEFIGITPYLEYEDRCWVISNLRAVTMDYLGQIVTAYDEIFSSFPEEFDNFRHFSIIQRRVFGMKHKAIILISRAGKYYKVSPRNGRLRRIEPMTLPKYGPYKIAAELPFPDESAD